MAVFLLTGSATLFAQETIDRIEIAHYTMVGWTIKAPKRLSCYVIENGQLYEQKRKNLELIGPCDTLAALLDRQKIDAIFRGEEEACADGYEANIRYTYHTIDQNVRTQYLYEYSAQTHCKDASDALYLRSIQNELRRLIEKEK